MGYEVILSHEADADLDQIAVYTLENWGEAQLESYISSLYETMYSLENNPARKGTSRDDLLSGLRSIPHQNHYHIFLPGAWQDRRDFKNFTSTQGLAAFFS